MKEIFYEESSKIQNVKSAKTKYMIFKVLSILSYVLLGLWCYFIFMFMEFGKGSLILNIILAIIPIIMFIVSGIIFGKFKNRFYVDYDYTFVSGDVRISKIIKEIRRKPVISFSTSFIEMLGKYDSETFHKYSKMPGVKKMILTSNVISDEGKDFYYIVVNTANGKKLLVLECSETFIVNILKFSSKSVVEKDFV